MNIKDLEYQSANNYFRSVVFNQLGGQDGARFQVVKVPAGEDVSSHAHKKRTEVFVVLGGEGQILINGQIVASKTHDIALCEPNDVHRVINTGKENFLIGVFALNYDKNDSIEEGE